MYNYDRRFTAADSSAEEAKKLDTPKLYSKTLELLKAKKLGPARAYLEELSGRKDNKKKVPAVKTFGITGPFADSLQDRVDEVNSR